MRFSIESFFGSRGTEQASTSTSQIVRPIGGGSGPMPGEVKRDYFAEDLARIRMYPTLGPRNGGFTWKRRAESGVKR